MRRMADWRPLERVQAVFSPTAALRRGTTLMAAGKTGPAFHLYARAGFRLVDSGPHHSFGHDLVEETWLLEL